MVDEDTQQDRPQRVKAAPLDPTEEQLELARQRTVRPPTPDLSNQATRRAPGDPRLPVTGSYRDQRYRFRLDGVRYQLAPEPDGPSDAGAPAGSFHLLSAWSPLGPASTLGACEQAHAALRTALVERDLAPVPAVTVASDRTWFERSLLVPGLVDDQALALARSFGQPAVVRWQGATLSVLPSGLRDDVPAQQVPCRLDVIGPTGCPVREDQDPTGRCVGHGGPWTGSSRRAAALWTGHRGLAVELLGCTSCDDGREPAWGTVARGASLSPSLVPSSRYGGPTFQR